MEASGCSSLAERRFHTKGESHPGEGKDIRAHDKRGNYYLRFGCRVSVTVITRLFNPFFSLRVGISVTSTRVRLPWFVSPRAAGMAGDLDGQPEDPVADVNRFGRLFHPALGGNGPGLPCSTSSWGSSCGSTFGTQLPLPIGHGWSRCTEVCISRAALQRPHTPEVWLVSLVDNS